MISHCIVCHRYASKLILELLVITHICAVLRICFQKNNSAVATKELRILGSNNEAGDWEEIYKNPDMELESGIEILVDKPGPYQYLRVEGNKATEGGSDLVSLKSFEPIFEQDCEPPTIVEQYGTMKEDASDVLTRDDRQWRAEAGGYFIIDLGCIAAVDSIEIDNRKQSGDFTETLEVWAGESKLGPWKSIYYTWNLKPDPDIVLEMNNPGPYRFLKVEAVSADTDTNWVGFYFFHPKVHKTTGRIFTKKWVDYYNLPDCSWNLVRRSQGSGFADFDDNMKGTLEEGEFGFNNDFTVRFDSMDYNQVGI